MLVKRDSNKTVTTLEILIPARRAEAEGDATFEGELNIQTVRALRNDDLKNASDAMEPEEAQHFQAIAILIKALGQKPDALAIKKAVDQLNQAYALKKRLRGRLFRFTATEQSQVGSVVAGLMGLPPDRAEEAMEVLEGLRPGPRASKDPRWLVAYEVSEALKHCRLVLWWTGGAFRPALWCPTLKTAFYARALLSFVGITKFRVCPYCGRPFFQKRSNQQYCKIEHREAHRVARWREQQKFSKARTRKGGVHVSGKTR